MATESTSQKFRDKFQLDLEIHYLQCKLPEDCELVIDAQCGKSFNKSTNPILYSTSTSHAFFDIKLSGSLKLIKKGSKYSKKTLKLKVIQNKSQSSIGTLVIDLSHLPLMKSPIRKREINLNNCADKTGLICLSLALNLLQSEEVREVEKTNTKKKRKNKKSTEFELESRNKDLDDFNTASMSFSDFILNPKDSDVQSESSSSEEEYKEVSAQRISSLNQPKNDMHEVTPNEGSKAYMIADAELKNGIMPTRQKGNCVNCVIT